MSAHIRRLHALHVLVRDQCQGQTWFCLQEHSKWTDHAGRSLLAPPTKKTVAEPGADVLDGVSIERFVDEVMQGELQLERNDYLLDQELELASVEHVSPTQHELTLYEVCPVDVWVEPGRRAGLAAASGGKWLTIDEALAHAQLSPTAKTTFEMLRDREQRLNARYAANPAEEQAPGAPRRLLAGVPARPTMEMLAHKWLAANAGGLRVLHGAELKAILAAGGRAFNLRVADPYLDYQDQGLGFTWSFFTHKVRQDLHYHGTPIFEIYGILEGRLEMWWKPFHARGTSAWSHRVLEPGDWAEVGPRQCHIVRWAGEGMGIVFKAGAGQLAGVGRPGLCGKTSCKDCTCIKPGEVQQLETLLSS